MCKWNTIAEFGFHLFFSILIRLILIVNTFKDVLNNIYTCPWKRTTLQMRMVVAYQKQCKIALFIIII